jgi:hypothetical protein
VEMAKNTTTEHFEAVAADEAQSSSRSGLDSNDQRVESGSPNDAPFDVVDSFAQGHGLSAHVDVFHKAALIVRGDTALEDAGLSTHELQALQNEAGARKWRQPKMLYFTILVCSLGAIEQGWAQTGMNGANLYFPKAFGIGSNSRHDNFVVGLINSGIYVSTGLFGAWLSDPLNNQLGRRGTIFAGATLCCVSNIGSALSQSWPQLLLSRLVLGIGLGLDASSRPGIFL